MQFKIKVRNAIRGEWWETYTKDITDPHAWARDTIDRFNQTLRPGESPRELVAVEIISEGPLPHDWVKHTAGMSAPVAGGHADLCYCARCGITGKRRGLSATVQRDRRFRAAVYERCDTALAHLKRNPR